MPSTVPVAGIALCADPACTAPQVRLTPERGSSRRPRIAGTCVMTWPSAKTTSPVRCGRDVWPPGPETVTVTSSLARRDRADARPDLPDVDLRVAVERVDLRRRRPARPRRPRRARRRAAPPRRAGTPAARRCGSSSATCASTSPAPRTAVVCTSCPQACATPRTVDAHGTPLVVRQRAARRGRRAGRSACARSSAGPGTDVADQARCPAAGAGSSPAARSRSATSAVVRTSVRPSSGCAWMSRRTATSSSRSSATRAASRADIGSVGSGRRLVSGATTGSV